MTDPKYIVLDFPHCLGHAIEEAGEFLSAAGKTQRWGLDSYNPDLPPDQRESNRDWLLREMHDLEGALYRLRRVLAPTDALQGMVSDISYRHLLERAVRNARSRDYRKGERHPRWAGVMDCFGLGGIYAHQLCRLFDLDPDEKVKR